MSSEHFNSEAARHPSNYERLWQIELRAEALFKAEFPSGSFARRLPQFHSSYSDPVGDFYRRLAEEELVSDVGDGA